MTSRSPGIEIRFLKTSQTLKLRQKVLRPLMHPEECRTPEDDGPLAFHLGLFQVGELAAVATFQPQCHANLDAGFPFRLRWMAVDPKHRRRGFGVKIMQRGLDVLRERHADLLWFNARENAFQFYASLGFVPLGPLFDMPGIGPHKVMYRHLLSR